MQGQAGGQRPNHQARYATSEGHVSGGSSPALQSPSMGPQPSRGFAAGLPSAGMPFARLPSSVGQSTDLLPLLQHFQLPVLLAGSSSSLTCNRSFSRDAVFTSQGSSVYSHHHRSLCVKLTNVELLYRSRDKVVLAAPGGDIPGQHHMPSCKPAVYLDLMVKHTGQDGY